jgi:hypothetical protein
VSVAREAGEEGEAFVQSFVQADFLFKPRHITEHNDIQREAKLYQQVIGTTTSLTADTTLRACHTKSLLRRDSARRGKEFLHVPDPLAFTAYRHMPCCGVGAGA